jgi:hypothetical protein
MLDRIHKISEIAAAFAIVASLVFVGFQLNQNTDAMKNNVIQMNASNWQDVLLTLASNPELRSDWVSFMPEDRQMAPEMSSMVFITNAMLRSSEFDYLQWREGNLSDERWQTARSSLVALLATQPGIEQVWNFGGRVNYVPAFQDLFEEALLEAKAMASAQKTAGS